MWGFLSATLVLVALQAASQPGASKNLAAGSGVIGSALNRLLSSGVAGIPQTKGAKAAAKAASAAPAVGDGSAQINPRTGLPYAFDNVTIPPGGPAGSPGPGSGSGPA